MRNLLAKVGRFFEAHVEKMVLGVVGLFSLYLLVTQVTLGPNRVIYDKLAYSPGSIDVQISHKAQDVAANLDRDPVTQGAYQSRLQGFLDVNDPVRKGFRGELKGGFKELLGSSIGHLDRKVIQPLPLYVASESTAAPVKGRTYRLPQVGDIQDVKADYIRAAAYVPTSPITDGSPYDESRSELNDVDFVTVEAKFDVVGLYERFHESFVGDEVPAAWRDTSLAEPVFAGVQLQRRQWLGNGQWSDWQDVPRGRVEARRDILSIPESTPGLGASGVQVRKVQFSSKDLLCDLLQPATYQIASTYEEWLPPTLHREYLDLLTKQRKEEQRQAREDEKANQQGDRPDRRRPTEALPGMESGRMGSDARGRGDASMGRGGVDPRTGRATTRSGRGDSRLNSMMPPGSDPARGGRRSTTRSGASGRPEDAARDQFMMMGSGISETQMAINQVYMKFEELRLSPMTDYARLKVLVFWAHDDTVEPGHQYQYRIRLGVLNPVAGTDQVAVADLSRKDEVILWSDFSDTTPATNIPARKYFFAKEFQENSGSVSVEVCKFILGYWRSQDFSVRAGEAIGRVVEPKSQDTRSRLLSLDPMAQYGMPMLPAEDQTFQLAEIDYGTGVTMVSVSRVDGWTGGSRLRPQVYYDMLYSSDGSEIQRTPIGTPSWSTEQSNAFNEIKKRQREPVEAPKAWKQAAGGMYGYGGRDPRGGMPMMGGRPGRTMMPPGSTPPR